jgi:hypothetical protein
MPKTAANRASATLPSRPDDAAVTIGGLARAAEVEVETVRYYQRRHLLAVPTGEVMSRGAHTTPIELPARRRREG